MNKLSLLKELWEFGKSRKKWWFLPVLFFLLLLGSFMFLSQGSVIAPFVYPIF